MKLQGQLVAVAHLTADERNAMFVLMDRHYVNVQPSIFDADLNEKQGVQGLQEGRLDGEEIAGQQLIFVTRDERAPRRCSSPQRGGGHPMSPQSRPHARTPRARSPPGHPAWPRQRPGETSAVFPAYRRRRG